MKINFLIKLLYLFLLFSVSCKSNVKENDLIIPPNYDEIPKDEPIKKGSSQDINIDKLKDILLESDEF